MERRILTGAMLIDGSGAPPAAGRAVVVENGRIAGVVAERDAPAGTPLRLDGLTLLAGLINCHVHLCLEAEADPAAVMLNEPYAATVAAGIPEFAVRKSLEVRDRHVESFQMAMRLGVTIAAGTDAGTPLNAHGSMVPELELMVKAGMAPLAAIHAATATAARVLGLEDETGRVAPGLAADLLAVAGNPAERIQALDEVRLVMARGRLIVNRT